MLTGQTRLVPVLFVAALSLGACGGGSDSTSLTVQTVTQDLTVDPDGETTVVAFASTAPTVALTDVEADNGATAQSVTADGSELTIVWDSRVTPSDQVRFVGVSGVSSVYRPVVTSDSSAPTYSVTAATQGVGLGADTITVEFSGPRVVPSQVTTGSNWTATINGQDFPLTGSGLLFDEATQTLTVTTDPSVNLHASFTLAVASLTSVADVAVAATAVNGAATGDAVAPSLVSFEQQLGQDEFGRVLELTFDEALDPTAATNLANYATASLVFPTAAALTDPTTVRLTFPQPMVPGDDTVFVQGILDAHGNNFPSGFQAIAAGSTVANAYDGNPALVTVAGVGGDQLVVVTTQALDPESAVDPASWTLDVDGNPITLADQTLAYDLLTKTLTIGLDADQSNGESFDLTPVAPLDVDGETFTTPFSGTVAGDVDAPTILSAVQNRDEDTDGVVVDVTFSEDVDDTTAETLVNWTINGGPSLVSAARQTDASVVRLTLDAAAVPGDVTFDLTGLTDPAGNAISAVAGQGLTSTDTTAPSATSATAVGIVGIQNDTLEVVFDDLLVESDITNPANWVLQAPVGDALDLTGCTVAWDATERTALATLDSPAELDFQVNDTFLLSFLNVRDLGGNSLGSSTVGGFAAVENVLPEIETVWVRQAPEDDEVVVVFTEPVAEPDADVLGTLTDGAGSDVANAVTSQRVPGEPRQLEFDFNTPVTAGINELDLAGVLDVAGNPFISIAAAAIAAEDTNEIDLDALSTSVTAVSGADNDTLVVTFDRAPSRWTLFDLANYTLTLAATSQDLTGAAIAYDGALEVTLTLDGGLAIETGASYTLEVDGIDTAQGVAPSAAVSAAVTAAGDAVAPAVSAGQVRLDPSAPLTSAIVEFSEAMDATELVDTANYSIGATNPTSVTALGARAARVTFAGGLIEGDTLDLTVSDLAGNVGVASQAIGAADISGPTVVSVTPVAVEGTGGDFVWVQFSEPVTEASATDPGHFALTVGGAGVSLYQASLTYDSSNDRTRIQLTALNELDVNSTASVIVSGVEDVSGNAMPAAQTTIAAIAGDTTAPGIESAAIDFRTSATGDVVLLRFDEEVTLDFKIFGPLYSASGGQTGTAAAPVDAQTVRVTFDAPLGAGDTVSISDVIDIAGNQSGALAIDPVE